VIPHALEIIQHKQGLRNPLRYLALLLHSIWFDHLESRPTRRDNRGILHPRLICQRSRTRLTRLLGEALPSTSGPSLCLLNSVGLTALFRVAGSILGPCSPLPNHARSRAAVLRTITTAWLTAAAEIEPLAAPATKPKEQNVTTVVRSPSHPCAEQTSSRRRHPLALQSVRDKAEPPAGRPGSYPGRPSRLLSHQFLLGFTDRKVFCLPRSFRCLSTQGEGILTATVRAYHTATST
jgi:hypothetical protein